MKKAYGFYRPGKIELRSEVDCEELDKEFKRNQPVEIRVYKIGKDFEPSLEQSNTLHACFKLVCDNSSNPCHATPESVKMACKVGTNFVDPTMIFIRPDGGVQLKYRSMAFAHLRGAEREQWVDKFFSWCAGVLGITVEVMIAEAKSRMRSGHFCAATVIF